MENVLPISVHEQEYFSSSLSGYISILSHKLTIALSEITTNTGNAQRQFYVIRAPSRPTFAIPRGGQKKKNIALINPPLSSYFSQEELVHNCRICNVKLFIGTHPSVTKPVQHYGQKISAILKPGNERRSGSRREPRSYFQVSGACNRHVFGLGVAHPLNVS